MNKEPQLIVTDEAWLELSNIAEGVLHPLTGFMNGKDYRAVVDHMHLASGAPWTIPVTLELPEERRAELSGCGRLRLMNGAGQTVGELSVEDIFMVDRENDLRKVYGTVDRAHPGVDKEGSRSPWRIGGTTKLLHNIPSPFPDLHRTPAQARELFKAKGWVTVVGFQTRNPIHRAHEHLQRVGMEIVDGIWVQPLIGWKKPDDFSPQAVVGAYRVMFELFYPPEHAALGLLTTPMRYAGPREAIFHALIRRNYGCTHFIVGRDHAGVGNFYGKYEAHELCRRFNDLGIEILPLRGPFHCRTCGGIVTDKHCPHGDDHSTEVSGTQLRRMLSKGILPPSQFMRPEISEVLLNLAKTGQLFNS